MQGVASHAPAGRFGLDASARRVPPFTSARTSLGRTRCLTAQAQNTSKGRAPQQPEELSLWQRVQDGLRQAGTCAAATAMALSLALPALAPPQAQAVSTEQLVFLEGWRAIDRAYYDKSFNDTPWFRVRETFLKQEKFDTREDTYAAIRKLLALLDDPFTRHLPPARLEALRKGSAGNVTGVGVEVTFDVAQGANAEPVVVAPLAGGPSERAGVRAGDVIPSIDGKPTRGLSLYEVSDLLRGPPDSEVVLSVKTGSAAARQVTLKREVLNIIPVSHGVCSGVPGAAVGLPAAGDSAKVGYVRVITFNANTTLAVAQAVKEIKDAKADGLVLDLRNNGGGLFPAGVQVAKMLLERGDIVLIADAQGVRDIYSADNSAIDAKTPLSIWVNKGTASASEVLAGALKDNKRGVVVGSNTFGKGLIQTVVDLSDGSGMAITVARYQTPAGTDINRVGVTPDIQLAPDSLPVGTDAVCKVLAGPAAPKVFA